MVKQLFDCDMNQRKFQKERTRRALIEAALSRLGSDRGFASLSLREVAREAGIAPTSFYRHFHDLDELGLTLVHEAGVSLRNLMRQVRDRQQRDAGVVRASVEAFMAFLEENDRLFHVLLRERAVGSRPYRAAIRRVLDGFVQDLAEDLQQENIARGTTIVEPWLVADTIVTLVLNGGAEILDRPRGERQGVTESVIRQVHMVVRGAQALAHESQELTTEE